VVSITRYELWKHGLSRLTVADLNWDGVLDVADIAAFAAGIRPAPRTLQRAGGAGVVGPRSVPGLR
jgi:hypothetical protein